MKDNAGNPITDGNGQQVYDLNVSDIVDLILCAIEYKSIQNKTPFNFTDVDFCQWVDDYAFATKEQGVIIKIYQHSTATDEKKSDQEAA